MDFAQASSGILSRGMCMSAAHRAALVAPRSVFATSACWPHYRQNEVLTDASHPSIYSLANPVNGDAPAEMFFDACPEDLAHMVVRVPRSAAIVRTACHPGTHRCVPRAASRARGNVGRSLACRTDRVHQVTGGCCAEIEAAEEGWRIAPPPLAAAMV